MSYTIDKQGLVYPSSGEIRRKKLLDAWLGPDSDNQDNHLSELRYEPLPPGHVRLLTLMPGKDFDPIIVSLEKAVVRDCKYEALSYCWGDASVLRPITCNDCWLNVTRNLKSALRDLRHPHISRTLWIDAICINQKDSKERGQQVRIMGDIYGLAERTVVWLGDSFVGVELAFQLVDRMRKLYSKDDVKTMPKLQKIIPKDDMPTAHELTAVDLLLRRPWFRRIWVTQEAALSKKVLVTCGDQKTTWDRFCYGVLLVLIYVKPRAALSTQVKILHQMWNLRQAIHNSNKRLSLDLLHLLCQFRGCLSTDPRDKLFALLGLTDTKLGGDNDGDHIVPDYSSSTQVVYTRLARFILKSSNSLDILSMAHGTAELSGSLPSWVPDWSDSRAETPLDRTMDGIKPSPFWATGPSNETRVAFEDDHILLLYGHRLDNIEISSIVFPKVGMDLEEFAEKQYETKVYHSSNFIFAPLQNPTSALKRYYNLYISVLQLFLWAWRLAGKLALQVDAMVQWNEIALSTAKDPTTAIYPPTGELLQIAYMSTLNINPTLDLNESTQNGYQAWWQDCRPTILLRRFKLDKVLGHRLYHLVIALIYLIRSQKHLNQGSQFGILKKLIEGRRLSWTSKGYLGLFPADSRTKDEVWLLKGGKLPFVLRRLNDGKYKLIGDCYVRGVMNGECFEEERCEKIRIV